MSYKIIISLFFGFLLIIILSPLNKHAHGNSFGAPLISGRGYTNSPFDARACNNVGCHSATLNSGPGIPEITTTIPSSGYKAGKRYSVTARIEETGRVRFGFQMTTETVQKLKKGKFIAGSETRTPSDFYITHGTSASSTTGNGLRTWTFNWDAPEEAGEGKITLYAAFNASNNNNSVSGDRIYTISLDLEEDVLSGLENNTDESPLLYPNPAKETFTIELSKEMASKGKLVIYDINGRKMKEVRLDEGTNNRQQINVSDLSPNIYYVLIENNTLRRIVKLIVN